MVLAICTFLAVNIFGTKHYWKDIFWPDVPWWLKVPVPMMPFIEFFGIFTKPFALMIRLFANMLAGHMAMLVLTCLIFISASMGPALNGTLTVASVLFNIFMNALELLVAFIPGICIHHAFGRIYRTGAGRCKSKSRINAKREQINKRENKPF